MLERMIRGGFPSGGLLADVLLIALLDTGVPVWALDTADARGARWGSARASRASRSGAAREAPLAAGGKAGGGRQPRRARGRCSDELAPGHAPRARSARADAVRGPGRGRPDAVCRGGAVGAAERPGSALSTARGSALGASAAAGRIGPSVVGRRACVESGSAGPRPRAPGGGCAGAARAVRPGEGAAARRQALAEGADRAPGARAVGHRRRALPLHPGAARAGCTRAQRPPPARPRRARARTRPAGRRAAGAARARRPRAPSTSAAPASSSSG